MIWASRTRRTVRSPSILFDKFPNTLKLAARGHHHRDLLRHCGRHHLRRQAILVLGRAGDASARRSSCRCPCSGWACCCRSSSAIKFKQWGLPYLPISGMSSRQFPTAVHLILPAITLASVSTAYAARIMRSQLLEVMGQDYIRTAAAKGFSGARVIWGHGMKNAMIPVVTYFGLDLGAMMGGTILTETVFNWPGVGYEIYLAIGQRDWPIVMGGTIIIVFMVMVINLLVDISYAFLDPRIRYGRQVA